MVYTFQEELTLYGAEAIRVALDKGPARIVSRTYHLHPHTGDRWHYAFPGDDSTEGILPLPECMLQGSNILALA